MELAQDIAAVMRDYPQVFLACHRRHVRDPATGTLVSERQVQVLDHLDELAAISVTALASHMGVTPSTMSLTVDRLVRRGFVRRRPDPTDRRRVLLTLTPAGARVAEAQSVLDPELVRQLVGGLSDSERRLAVDGLALLARAATQVMRSKKAEAQSA